MSDLPQTHCLIDEFITRFISSRKHFRPSDNRVKPRAFEPSTKTQTTSVFRILGLDDDAIWRLWFDHVVVQNPRNLHARADVSVNSIINAQLNVIPQEPPPRHANIVNWPEEKSARISLAQRIAAESELFIPPEE